MKHKGGITETHINQTPTVVSPCTSVGSHLVPDMVSSGWFSSLCAAGVSEHPSSLAGRGRGLSGMSLRYVGAHTCGQKAAVSSSFRLLLPLDAAGGPCYGHFNGFNYHRNNYVR